MEKRNSYAGVYISPGLNSSIMDGIYESDMEDGQTPPDQGLPIEQEHEHPDEDTSRLYHVKIQYCPYIKWSNLAGKIFEPEPAKCLVMAENLSKSTGHVHMQGYTKRSDRALKKIREDIHSGHSLMAEFKRKRVADPAYARAHKRIQLSSELKKEPTETGFQYICKEVNVPLYSQGFTPEELADLHENSNIHVKAKKQAVADILEPLFQKGIANFPTHDYEEKMKKLVAACKVKVVEARVAAGQWISMRYFKEDILNYLAANRRCTRECTKVLAEMF